MKRRWPLLLFLLFLLLVVGGVAYLYLGRPNPEKLPRLDSSTPAQQGGFTALQVSPGDEHSNVDYRVEQSLSFWERVGQLFRGRGSSTTRIIYSANTLVESGRGGAGLWVRPPVQPNQPLFPPLTPNSYTATGRAPNGEIFPLKWQMMFIGPQPAPTLVVEIPGGYPESYKYLDVSLKDGKGHSGTWRVHLLPAKHVIQTPVAAGKDVFQAAGFTVFGHVWRVPKSSSLAINSPLESVSLGVGAKGNPSLPGKWEMRFDSLGWEWMAASQDIGAMTIPMFMQGVVGSTGVVVSTESLIPYSSHNKWAQLGGILQQFEVLDAPVTFHNLRVISQAHNYYLVVTKPQSVTTPGGVTITLPVQNTPKMLQGFSFGSSSRALHMQVQYPDSLSLDALARSAFAKKHNGKPKILVLSETDPFSMASWGSTPIAGNIHDITLEWHNPSGDSATLIPALTLKIRQRIDLQSYPFQLTVPVQDQPSHNSP